MIHLTNEEAQQKYMDIKGRLEGLGISEEAADASFARVFADWVEEEVLKRQEKKNAWTVVNLRHTSDSEHFPYAAKTVPFILLDTMRKTISFATSKRQKESLLYSAGENDKVLTVWPGQWKSDVFVIDDLASAREKLG